MITRFTKLTLIVCSVMGFLCLTATARQTHRQLTRVTDYWLYLPQEYEADTTVRWPLIMCLHGGAEDKSRGRTPEAAREIGIAGYIHKEGHEYPCIVVSPQAEGGWDPKILIHVLMEVMNEHRVDPERIYLTGLSMGGNGTWEFAMQFPSLFAAIAPICGPDTDTTHI